MGESAFFVGIACCLSSHASDSTFVLDVRQIPWMQLKFLDESSFDTRSMSPVCESFGLFCDEGLRVRARVVFWSFVLLCGAAGSAVRVIREGYDG